MSPPRLSFYYNYSTDPENVTQIDLSLNVHWDFGVEIVNTLEGLQIWEEFSETGS